MIRWRRTGFSRSIVVVYSVTIPVRSGISLGVMNIYPESKAVVVGNHWFQLLSWTLQCYWCCWKIVFVPFCKELPHFFDVGWLVRAEILVVLFGADLAV